MPPLRDLSPLTLAGCMAVLSMGLLAFVGLLGLRLQRRGSARFWASPAALALCLLPGATAAAFAALLLRQSLAGMALTGAGGVAASAAGAAEALVPLQLGLGVLLALVACAFLVTAAGSSRSTSPASSPLGAWALLSVALLALALLCGMVGLVLSMAARLNGTSLDPRALASHLGLVLAGSAALVAVTFALALAGAFIAPRGSSDLAIRIGSLATFALCGLLAVAGLRVTWTRSQSLMATAFTGVPDGELPEPARMPVFVEPSEAPPPPPPPPPPRVTRPERPHPPEPVRRSIREARGTAVPSPSGEVHRVGGSIREPRKIRNVSPIYPEIAKQARVQGVVILEATIGPRGDVTAVRVLRGAPLLDQSAIDAVKQWVYEPTVLNGVPVPVIMTVTVSYKLAAP